MQNRCAPRIFRWGQGADSKAIHNLFDVKDYVINTWCVQVLRSKEAFAAAMHSWRERCEKCVCLQGDYAEK